MKYPVRCKIIDVTGKIKFGFHLKTPDASKPYIGEEGLAEEVEGKVRIKLDNGETIYGHECWWKPLKD